MGPFRGAIDMEPFDCASGSISKNNRHLEYNICSKFHKFCTKCTILPKCDQNLTDYIRLREKRQEFQLKLKNRFDSLNVEGAEVDEKCQLISDTLLEVAAETAPQGKQVKVITEEDKVIEALDKKRKELREIQNKSTSQKVEYAELVKTVRKKRRQRSRKKRDRKIKTILKSGKGGRHINKMNRKKTRMHQLKKDDGTIANDRQDILDVCADFYQKLYKFQTPFSS